MNASGRTTDQTPLVSVIMAAFNAESYVADTCRSVLDQTYPHLELIVVDDGSTDATAAIVTSIAAADGRVRLIRQSNRGVAAARNTAINHAAGDLIAPIDADDLWVASKIERQVHALQQEPDAAFVYCWWAWIDHDGRIVDRSPRWRVTGRAFEKLIEVNFTGNASVPLFRRAALERAGGYDTDLQAKGSQGCEDWNLALRVAAHNSITVVPAVLAGYRRHAEGMSRNCTRMWRSHELMCKSLSASGLLSAPDLIRRSRSQFSLYLAGVAFWAGDYWQATGWALRARTLTLALLVAYIPAVIGRRIARPRSAPLLFLDRSGTLDEELLPEPLIPYDRIYQLLWRQCSTARDTR